MNAQSTTTNHDLIEQPPVNPWKRQSTTAGIAEALDQGLQQGGSPTSQEWIVNDIARRIASRVSHAENYCDDSIESFNEGMRDMRKNTSASRKAAGEAFVSAQEAHRHAIAANQAIQDAHLEIASLKQERKELKALLDVLVHDRVIMIGLSIIVSVVVCVLFNIGGSSPQPQQRTASEVHHVT